MNQTWRLAGAPEQSTYHLRPQPGAGDELIVYANSFKQAAFFARLGAWAKSPEEPFGILQWYHNPHTKGILDLLKSTPFRLWDGCVQFATLGFFGDMPLPLVWGLMRWHRKLRHDEEFPDLPELKAAHDVLRARMLTTIPEKGSELGFDPFVEVSLVSTPADTLPLAAGLPFQRDHAVASIVR